MKHIPRFFVKEQLTVGQEITLDQAQSHHLSAVLRRDIGQSVYIFNNTNGEYAGKLTQAHKKNSRVQIIEQKRTPEVTPEIHLVFSPLKSQRTDMVLEKGTELGVTHFHPCTFDYSTTHHFRVDKAYQLCLQATQQCGRLAPPFIYEQAKLRSVLESIDSQQVLICDIDPDSRFWTDISLDKTKPIVLIVGPEGGISALERTQLQKLPNAQQISLSQNVLRAETAVVASLAIIGCLTKA